MLRAHRDDYTTLISATSGSPTKYTRQYVEGELSRQVSAKRANHATAYVGECAAVQEIADWLDELGSEYAQRFAENGVSVAALHHLTDQDLKTVLLGHRRLVLAAIRELSGELPLERRKPYALGRRRPKTPPSAAKSL